VSVPKEPREEHVNDSTCECIGIVVNDFKLSRSNLNCEYNALVLFM